MNGKRKSESVAAAVPHKQFMRYIENKKYRRRRRERERKGGRDREREKQREKERERGREREGEGEKDGLIDSIGIGR